MSRSLPIIKAGGDWAALLRGRLRREAGDLSHDAVVRTRRRLNLAIVVFMLVFAVLGSRLAHLTMLSGYQVIDRTAILQGAQKPRPIITDRNGVVLATQIYLTTLGVDTAQIDKNESDKIDALVATLKQIVPDMNAPRAAKLMRGKNRYVVLAKRLMPDQHQAILALGNPALRLNREPHRVYPTGAVAAHITGFSSSDMRGLAGLERTLDRYNALYGEDENFATSIDIRVQHVVRDELLRGLEKFKARAASAIIMDAHNGEVLAMVSLPDFDANRPSYDSGAYNSGAYDSQGTGTHVTGTLATGTLATGTLAAHFNNATLGVYELGSIFKIFTAAMALESGLIADDETFQTSAPIQFGRFTISDMHGQDRPLTIAEIVTHSSNIGSVQLALRVSADEHMDFLNKLGLTMRLSDFELPETSAPLVPNRWTDIERATISYGHGISITPLHAVAAGAAMINGGVLYHPSLSKVALPVGQRVISAATSQKIRVMMRNVVRHGTGGKANVRGYGVMGKTGSGDKPQAGAYSSTALVTSFMGGFPAHAPRYALLVMYDEPQGIAETHDFALAGWNAAPTTAAIIRRAAPLLGVMPHNNVAEGEASLSPIWRAKIDAMETYHAP